MVTGKWYVVTKASDSETFMVGDHICLNDDGSISIREAQGWVDVEDVPEATIGMECTIDTDWLERRKAKLQKELAWLSSGE